MSLAQSLKSLNSLDLEVKIPAGDRGEVGRIKTRRCIRSPILWSICLCYLCKPNCAAWYFEDLFLDAHSPQKFSLVSLLLVPTMYSSLHSGLGNYLLLICGLTKHRTSHGTDIDKDQKKKKKRYSQLSTTFEYWKKCNSEVIIKLETTTQCSLLKWFWKDKSL